MHGSAIKKARKESAFRHLLLELRKENKGNPHNHDISLIVLAHRDYYVKRSSLNYQSHVQGYDERKTLQCPYENTAHVTIPDNARPG